MVRLLVFLFGTLLVLEQTHAMLCSDVLEQAKRFLGTRHHTIDRRIAYRRADALSRPLARISKDVLGPALKPVNTFVELGRILETKDLISTFIKLEEIAPEFYTELVHRLHFLELVRGRRELYGYRLSEWEAKVLSHLLAQQLLQLKITLPSFQPALAFADGKNSAKPAQEIGKSVLNLDLYLDGTTPSLVLRNELQTAKKIAEDLQVRLENIQNILQAKKAIRQTADGIYSVSDRAQRGPWIHNPKYVSGGEIFSKDVLESDIHSLETILRDISLL